jgi:hypothetical protein
MEIPKQQILNLIESRMGATRLPRPALNSPIRSITSNTRTSYSSSGSTPEEALSQFAGGDDPSQSGGYGSDPSQSGGYGGDPSQGGGYGDDRGQGGDMGGAQDQY